MSWLTYPDLYENAGNFWLRISYDFALKSFLFLLVIFFLYQTCRRFPNAFRHFLLSLGFLCLFLLPAVFALGPTWRLPFLNAPSLLSSSFDITSGRIPPASLALVLFGIWFVGFAVVMLRLVVGLWIVRRLTCESLPLEDAAWRGVAATCSEELRLGRPIRLLVNHRLGAAICAGVTQPRVILPAVALGWCDEQRQTILRHELAHIKRRDNLTNVFALTVCAVYWFNPLVWWAAGRLRLCREAACDDLVLSAGTRPSHYVSYLLQASSLHESRSLSVALSQISALKKRVLTILDPGVNRRKSEPAHAIACLVLAGAALLSLAALEPWIIPEFGAGRAEELHPAQLPGLRFASGWFQSARSKLRGDLRITSQSFLHVEGSSSTERRAVFFERQPTSSITVGNASGHRPAGGSSLNPWFARHASSYGAPLWAQTYSPATAFPVGNGFPTSTQPIPDYGPPAGRDDQTAGNPPDLAITRLSLGTLGGAHSLATDINEAGRVVGASTNGVGEGRPFIWSKSDGISNLPCPSGDCQAIGINNSAQVLVIARNQTRTRSTSYLWSADEPIQNIGTLGGESTHALHLNDRGQVAGTSQTSFGTESAFFWSPETGMVNLGGSKAVALNERGQVAGWASSYAFFWDPETGSFSRIGGLDVKAEPVDMNNQGEIVGWAQFARNSQMKAFYWNVADGIVQLDLPGDPVASCAVQINDAGEVMAIARDYAGDEDEHVFLWRRGQEVRKATVPDVLLPRVNWDQGSNVTSSITLIGSNLPSSKLAEELAKVSFASKEEPEAVAQPVKMNGRGQIAGNLINAAQSKVQAVVWEIRLPKIEETIKEVLSQVPEKSSGHALKVLLNDALAALRDNDYDAANSSLTAFLEDLPTLDSSILPEQTRTRWTHSIWHSLDRLSHFTIVR